MTYSRPGTSEINALFKPAVPNRGGGNVDQRVSLGASGPLLDNRRADIAGANAGRQLSEIGSFIENFSKTAAPIYKAFQEVRGTKQATEVLANQIFTEGIVKNDPVARGLYDQTNSYGRELIRNSIGQGMVASYRDALPAALWADDALTRQKRPEETDEQYAADLSKVRLERQQSVLQRIGFSGLPSDFQQAIVPELVGIDQQAKGKTYALATQQNTKITDSNLLTATVGTVNGMAANIDQLIAAENIDVNNATPEQQQRLTAAYSQSTAAAGTKLIELYQGNNRGPLDVAPSLYGAAVQMATMENKEDAVKRIQTLRSIVESGGTDGKPLALNGQMLGAMSVGTNGLNLTAALRELENKLQDDLDAQRPQEILEGGAGLLRDVLAARDNDSRLAAYNRLLAHVQGFKDPKDIAAADQLLSRASQAFEATSPIIDDNAIRIKNQIESDYRSGRIDENTLRERARAQLPPRFAQELIDLSGNVLRDRLMQNNQLSDALKAQDEAAWERYRQDFNKKYPSQTIDENNQTKKDQFMNELRVGRDRRAEELVKQFQQQNNGRLPSAAEYSTIYTQANSQAAETKMGGIKAAPPTSSPTGKALNDNKIIQNNIKAGVRGQTLDVFRGTGVVALFRQFNPEKPPSYKAVSEWYVKYMGSLTNPDGGKAFADPTKLWRQMTKNASFGTDVVGRRMGGMGGMGMVDPTRGSALLQNGLNIVSSWFPDSTESVSRPPAQSASQPKPAGSAVAPARQQAPAPPAPRLQVAGLAALTGPPSAPVLPPPAARTGGAQPQASTDPTQILNQQNWAEFQRIWGRGNSPVATGSRFTPQTPAMPQVSGDKAVRAAPVVMRDVNHPNAVLIGVNEGTRTATGGFTSAYTGHRDPVRGYNQGNFSAQQGYATPQQADRKWLGEINRRTMAEFVPALRRAGLQPGTAAYERLLFNLQDLAVQSPLATNGLIAQIPKIVQQGATIESIAVARAKSFYNPANGRWEGTRPYSWMLRDQRSRAGTWDYKRRIGG